MINIIIHGCCGRMGKILRSVIDSHEGCHVVAGIDRSLNNFDDFSNNEEICFPVYSTIGECKQKADVVIDFSNHSATNSLLDYCIENKLAVVIATTALGKEQFDLMEYAATKIPVFYSSNMSIGINAIVNNLKNVVPYLEDDFNTEIIEKHHNKKVDSPSGTALLLANAINDASKTKKNYLYGRFDREGKCNINDLGIHSVRGGTICGEHTVIFAGYDEVIEITHRAYSREVFAIGALKAAKFLVNQGNGLYSMNNILG